MNPVVITIINPWKEFGQAGDGTSHSVFSGPIPAKKKMKYSWEIKGTMEAKSKQPGCKIH